ncbi:MAG: hypothetical protein RJA57_73 [Bacteroidota bacterium]|jgi:uncharacterized membrane protein YgcG
MKPIRSLLLVSVVLLQACSTAYRTGQTPDDVYYSPARGEKEEYVESERDNDRSNRYDDSYYDDRFLRMRVQNRLRWSTLDSWYLYDRYSIGYNYYFGSFFNPYNAWHVYYNPYGRFYPYKVYHPGNGLNPRPSSGPLVKRPINLSGYRGANYNLWNQGGMTKKPVTTTRPVYTNTNYNNRNNGISEKIRSVIPDGNSGRGSSRNYTPSSGNTSGGGRSASGNNSSGGNSGGGAVTRPVRQNN